jgi:hypothetical protein
VSRLSGRPAASRRAVQISSSRRRSERLCRPEWRKGFEGVKERGSGICSGAL